MVSNNRKMDKTTVIKSAIQVIQASKGIQYSEAHVSTSYYEFGASIFGDIKFYLLKYKQIKSNVHCLYLPILVMADELKSHEIKELWKPSFMTNNEFVHLMLEVSLIFTARLWNRKRVHHCP